MLVHSDSIVKFNSYLYFPYFFLFENSFPGQRNLLKKLFFNFFCPHDHVDVCLETSLLLSINHIRTATFGQGG